MAMSNAWQHLKGALLSDKVTLWTIGAGATAGFLGFFLSEVFTHDRQAQSFLGVIASTARWSAFIGLGLGAVLIAAENSLSLRGRWWRDLWWVPLGAAVLGGIGGGLGQAFYSLAGPSRITRAIGWTILGAGTGLMLGLADRSTVKALRGALGGAIGGFMGGLLFDTVAPLFHFGPRDTGVVARLVGLTIMGAAIGFMLRLVQEALKSAWLVGVTTGPYEGKQYILSKPVVTVGRSDANDVGLYREKDLPLKAGSFILKQGQWSWIGQGIGINGRVQDKAPLFSGDRLRFGATQFIFQSRDQESGRRTLEQHWVLHSNSQAYPPPHQMGKVTLGRAPHNGIVLEDASVSDQHAQLSIAAGGLILTDLGTGKTYVNDEPLAARQARSLKAGDLIRLGGLELAVLMER
jgi:hypothetical protein